MMHTVMSVRSNQHGLDLAAWVTFLRTVWINKADESALMMIKSVVDMLEINGMEAGCGESIPSHLQADIRKRGGNHLVKAATAIMKRGHYSIQTLPMRHGPAPRKEQRFRLDKRPYSRLIVFRYNPETDTFVIPATRKGSLGFLYYWNPIEFRDTNKESLSEEDQKLFSTIQYLKHMLRSENVERDYKQHELVVGHGMFKPTDHTEYDGEWLKQHGLDLVDAHAKRFHVTREALKKPETAKFVSFVFKHEVGPVMLDMHRIKPRIDFTFPDEIQVSDPWIFNGEDLELEG